jgi:hypothetical protein
MRMVRCEEGVSTRERIAVTGDVYNITGRIKEIDRDYFIMLNRMTQRFEVHVRGQWSTLECELPFDELDARTLRYVRERHISRLADIQKQLDREEAQRERNQAARLQELHERAAEGFRWAEKSMRDEFPEEVAEGLI